MFLTVCICTWNRAQLLDMALDSFNKLQIPKNTEWEFLIVNNNCSDETDEVIAKHAAKLPIRRLFEANPGKSYALNQAIRKARGEYILWTDDDALVDPNWMAAYAEAFKNWPEAAIFGGPVKPWFRNTPPKWLTEETLPFVASAYALIDYGEKHPELTKSILPYGVNMATRYKEQSRYMFDTNLGPRPNSELRGEEIALVIKMLEDGVKGRWVQGAFVRHYIPQERMTIRYLKNYYRGYGEFEWIEVKNGMTPNRFGSFWNLWKTAIEFELKYRYCRIVHKPRVWAGALVRSSVAWGRLLRRMSV